MSLTVRGPAFHVEGPADTDEAFFTTSTSAATIDWQGRFRGDVTWKNDGSAGTTCDVVVVYATSGPNGFLTLTPSIGTGGEVTLPAAATETHGESPWKVAAFVGAYTIPADATVTLTARIATAGTLWIRSIDIATR